MEEAPKGTFEDELNWCINQLETGLLRRNPTPRQVADTQRVLRVLLSRKAPFVKKRQVMNQVFGNYRLKMAEERRAQEQAANNSSEPKIQQVAAQETQSVVYRRSLKDVQSGAGHWFTPSSADFTFNFFPDQEQQPTEGMPKDGTEDHTKETNCTNTQTSQQDGDVRLDGGSQFTFSFQITEEACSTSESSAAGAGHESSAAGAGHESSAAGAGHESSAAGAGHESSTAGAGHESSTAGAEHAAPGILQESLSQNNCNLDNAASTSGVTDDQTEKTEAVEKNTADSPKKKKKKSKSKNTHAQAQNKAEEGSKNTEPVPPQKEEPKSGADDLRRELDWCVEQLEIGLQRQKSTPKQAEEALRAIKTLRSEKVPLVKKRQVMRVMFGDYRHKMEEERIKQLRLMQTAAKSAKMTEVTLTARQNSSTVFRKSNRRSPRNAAAPSSAAPADAQGSYDKTKEAPSPSQQEFTFRPSQEAFCFNFF